jgi:hypothetical protein
MQSHEIWQDHEISPLLKHNSTYSLDILWEKPKVFHFIHSAEESLIKSVDETYRIALHVEDDGLALEVPEAPSFLHHTFNATPLRMKKQAKFSVVSRRPSYGQYGLPGIPDHRYLCVSSHADRCGIEANLMDSLSPSL